MAGALALAGGALATLAPFAIGEWSIGLLGLLLLGSGLFEAAQTFFASGREVRLSSYLPAALAVLGRGRSADITVILLEGFPWREGARLPAGVVASA